MSAGSHIKLLKPAALMRFGPPGSGPRAGAGAGAGSADAGAAGYGDAGQPYPPDTLRADARAAASQALHEGRGGRQDVSEALQHEGSVEGSVEGGRVADHAGAGGAQWQGQPLTQAPGRRAALLTDMADSLAGIEGPAGIEGHRHASPSLLRVAEDGVPGAPARACRRQLHACVQTWQHACGMRSSVRLTRAGP